MSRRKRQQGLRGTSDTTSSAPPAPAPEGATQPEQELEAPPPAPEPDAPTGGEPEGDTAAADPAPDAPTGPGDQDGDDGPEDSEDPGGDGGAPPPSAPPSPRRRVRCRVIGPGSVKSHGRLYQEGETGEFDAADASELPQLDPIHDEV